MEAEYIPKYECGDLMIRMTHEPKYVLVLGNHDSKRYRIMALDDEHIAPYSHKLFDAIYCKAE